jgi:hypothetical protein
MQPCGGEGEGDRPGGKGDAPTRYRAPRPRPERGGGGLRGGIETGGKQGGMLTHGAPAQFWLGRFEWIQNSQTGSNGFEFKTKLVQTSFYPTRTFPGSKNLK